MRPSPNEYIPREVVGLGSKNPSKEILKVSEWTVGIHFSHHKNTCSRCWWRDSSMKWWEDYANGLQINHSKRYLLWNGTIRLLQCFERVMKLNARLMHSLNSMSIRNYKGKSTSVLIAERIRWRWQILYWCLGLWIWNETNETGNGYCSSIRSLDWWCVLNAQHFQQNISISI